MSKGGKPDDGRRCIYDRVNVWAGAGKRENRRCYNHKAPGSEHCHVHQPEGPAARLTQPPKFVVQVVEAEWREEVNRRIVRLENIVEQLCTRLGFAAKVVDDLKKRT